MKDLRNLDPLEYLKIIWRRRWYALAVFLLVCVAAAAYSWYTPEVFKSVSMIRIEPAVIPQDYARPSDRSTPEQQIAGIRQLVQSRSFAERLVQEFQLFGYRDGGEFSMDNAIRALAKNIQINSTSRDTFMISASSTDPQLSQTIVRRVVDTLIQSSTSSRKVRAVEADKFVDDQLRQTEQKLLAQEDKIKQFKIAHLGGLPEQSAANMNALNGLNAQLAAIENSLEQLRDRQKQMEFTAGQQKQLNKLSRSILDQPAAPNPAEGGIKSPVASNPVLEEKQRELNALLLKYTPNHPDVVRVSREVEELKRQAQASLSPGLSPVEGVDGSTPGLNEEALIGSDAILDIEAAEIRMQEETYKKEIAKREKERDALWAQIKAYQGRLNLAPALEQEFLGLSREHENLRQQYANLQNKKFQAELTTNLENGRNNDTYRIIDEANLPERPTFPDRTQIVLLGLGAGFVLGVAAAFGRELLDATLGSENEVVARLELPILASIAEIPQREPRRLLRKGGMAKNA